MPLQKISESAAKCLPGLGTGVQNGSEVSNSGAKGKSDGLSRWALAVEQRRGYWKAVVAIAAKNARMAWAVLTKGESFKLPT